MPVSTAPVPNVNAYFAMTTGGERCRRLTKECIPSPVTRKKRPRVNAARLELKLDGLESLLRSIAGNNPAIENAIDNLNLTTPEDQAAGYEPVSARVAHPPLTPASTATSSYPYVLPKDAEPTIEEAESYFKTFCARNLQHFPFTQFPDGMTAQQLRQERPFFWLCIMAISSNMVHRQFTLGQAIREIVAREILVKAQRNLDLLFGFALFCRMGQYQMHAGPFLTVYSHLCIAITLDIGLHKPTHKKNTYFGVRNMMLISQSRS
ncbi:hypothetical protein V1515DRAFT_425518 [Lipomyces mesembrius]